MDKKRNRFHITPYLFISPVFILLAALVVYPVSYTHLNVEVKLRMKESAVSCGFPQNRQGWGILDLRRLTGTK